MGPSLLILGATARDERRTVPADARGKPIEGGPGVGGGGTVYRRVAVPWRGRHALPRCAALPRTRRQASVARRGSSRAPRCRRRPCTPTRTSRAALLRDAKLGHLRRNNLS